MPKQMKLSELTPHPLNEEIYGSYSNMLEEARKELDDLKESIQEFGLLDRIVIDENNMIISGHRRFYALLELEYEETTVDQFKFSSEAKRITYLITKNAYRLKTNAQRIREGMFLESNVRLSAKENMAGKSDDDFRKIVTRDAVGKAVGMSGSTYERGKKVIEKIDELKEEGKVEEAKELEEKVNASVSGALKTAVPKKKPAPEKTPVDPLFWYKEELESLISYMRMKAEKMAKKRKSTSAQALSWFFYTIQEDAKRYSSWLPGKMMDCPICKGTMHLPSGADCKNCINGKVGVYEVPHDDDEDDESEPLHIVDEKVLETADSID